MKKYGLGLLLSVSVLLVFVISSFVLASPHFYNNQTSVVTTTSYAPGKNYGFQINVTQVNSSIAVWNVTNVTFTFGGIEYRNDTTGPLCIGSNCYAANAVLNFTLFNDTNGIFWINFTDLGAGAYNFQWKANETLNYIGNSTTSQVFNISKNVTVINLYLNSTTANQTSSIEFGDLVNVSATLSNITYGNATIYILKDGVLVGNSTNNSLNNLGFINASMNLTYLRPGTYNFSAVYDGNANYTSQTVSYTLTVRGLGTTNGTFFALSDQLRLNWTNFYLANITLVTNKTLNYSTNLILPNVYNGSTADVIISGNYSQDNSQYAPCSNMARKLFVTTFNTSGRFNETTSYSFDSTNSTNVGFSLDNVAECKPGRYATNTLTFRNLTFSGDNFNASLVIDVPVSGINVNLTGIGNFSGTMPAYSTYYHSYFFYTDGLRNATGVTANISWSSSSQNLDMFLFDNNGVLKAEAINTTQSNELLVYSRLPSSPAMWELRIYGNNSASTAYNGNIFYTSLNATNSSSNQTIDLINFGNLNASNTNQINITLNNEGNISLSGVIENKEIHFVKRFTCETTCSGEKNFTFVVPDSSIVNRIKANVTWVGDGNYTLNIYKPFNETADVTSINSVTSQNITGAWQERFNETSAITKGVWKLQIKNNTVTVSPYNASVVLYLADASSWFSSNYSTFDFNRSVYNQVLNNTNTTLRFNVIVQNNTLDGTYEGSLKYISSTNATLLVPFTFTAKTPTLVVNGTMQSTTLTVSANIGMNKTYALNVTFNNTGTYDMQFALQNSTNNLLMYGTKNIGFDYVASPAISVPANSFGTLNVTINLTVTNTSDTQGLYEGYIFFNATNNTLSLSSHPYSSFNLTIRVNLTNQLNVNIPRILNETGGNSINISGGNVTAYLQVYKNDTGDINSLTLDNFDKVWLQEGNVTNGNGLIPSSGNLTYNDFGTNPFYTTQLGGYYAYSINFTVPANIPGGLYKLHVITNAAIGGNNFTGESNNGTLVVNNAGLYMSNYSTTMSIDNTSSSRLYVNVTNYGPISRTVNLGLIESCAGYSVTAESASSACGTSTSGANFTDLDIPAHSSGCLLTFKITGVSSASACSGTIYAVPSNVLFNNLSVTVTVTGEGGSSSSTTSTTSGSSTSTTTTGTSTSGAALKYLEVVQPDKVLIVQGGANSTKVIVKNTNNTKTQNISLTVEDVNQSWVKSIDPAAANLITAGTNTSFTVAFSISNSTEVKDYNGTLKATSSFGSATTTFILRVLPGESKKIEINNTFELIKLNYTKLQNDFNESRQKGMNVSAAEKIFNEVSDLFNQAQTYINNGDYFSALQLFDQINAKMESTRSELTKSTGFNILGAFGNILNPVYIIIAVAAVGGLALLYLFWPTKLKYAPSVLQPKQQKEQPRPKIAEENVWEKLKKKWEEYYKKRKMMSPKQYYKYKGQ